MGYATLPLYEFQGHTGTKAAVVSGAVVIYGILISGDGAAADVQIMDALTDTGADDLQFNVISGDSKFYDFTPMGGVLFATGLSLTMDAGYVGIWTSVKQATA